jgi:hypothetical protein
MRLSIMIRITVLMSHTFDFLHYVVDMSHLQSVLEFPFCHYPFAQVSSQTKYVCFQLTRRVRNVLQVHFSFISNHCSKGSFQKGFYGYQRLQFNHFSGIMLPKLTTSLKFVIHLKIGAANSPRQRCCELLKRRVGG